MSTFNTVKKASDLQIGDIAFTNNGFIKVIDVTKTNITYITLYANFDTATQGKRYEAMSGERCIISATEMAANGLQDYNTKSTSPFASALQKKYGTSAGRDKIANIQLLEEDNLETNKGRKDRLMAS